MVLGDLDMGQKAMAGIGKTLSRRSKFFYFKAHSIFCCLKCGKVPVTR